MRNVGIENILVDTTVSLKEVTAPTFVRENTLKLYAKDLSDVSHLYYMDDALVEHEVSDAASVVHTLLNGSIHSDTESQTVSRGSLVYGNSTPKWDELVKGAASTLLKSDGTDIAWGTVTLLSAFHSDTAAGSVVRGDLIVGNSTPAWARFAKGSSGTILQMGANDPAWVALSTIDHGSLGGLTDDDHTQYALLLGRSGGQTLIGGTAASNNLVLRSTSNSTKGNITLVDDGGNVVVGGGATGILSLAGTGGYVDLSAISAGNPNLKVTATSDTPSTTWTAGVPNNNPAGYIEILVGANTRYVPFWT